MRPLAAALALLARATAATSNCAACARMHERPIGDLVDALRQLGCAIDYLGHDGLSRRCACAAGRAARCNTDAPIRVRGDVSSQFLTALLLALPLVSGARPIVVEVDGELISKPYVEITLNLLARFGIDVQRDGWQRFTIPRGQPLSLAAAHPCRRRRLVGLLLHRAGRHRGGGRRRCASKASGVDSIQGDIRFVDAARRWARASTGGPSWLEVRRGAWPLKAIDLDCNHIPDAAMTLAVMALYADGRTRLTQHRQLARQGNRPHRRDGRRSCASSAPRSVEGADFIEVEPPASPGGWRRAALRTYDDHRMAMCLSLAAFNPLPAARAGAHPRSALRRQDLSRLLRDPVRRGGHRHQRHPGDHDRRPDRLGQGHAGRPTSPHAWATTTSTRARCTASPRWPRCGAASRPTTRPSAGRALAGTLPLRFEGEPGAARRRRRDATRLRPEAVGMLASAVSALPAVRQALHDAAAVVSAACPAWWPTGATWAP